MRDLGAGSYSVAVSAIADAPSCQLKTFGAVFDVRLDPDSHEPKPWWMNPFCTALLILVLTLWIFVIAKRKSS